MSNDKPEPVSKPSEHAAPTPITGTVPIPPEFLAMYPDAATRQTTPVTDFADALGFHKAAVLNWFACTSGTKSGLDAARAGAAKAGAAKMAAKK